MKLSQLLEADAMEEIAALIKRDCQPFIKAGAPNLWRGIDQDDKMLRQIKSDEYSARTFYIGSTRNDRIPKDMPKSVHKMLNDFFSKHVGVPLRSASLFVTGDFHMAQGYGEPYGIFPIGEFHYAWSPSIGDAFRTLIKYPDPDYWRGNFAKYMWKSAKELKIDISDGFDGPQYEQILRHTFDNYGDKIYKFDQGLRSAVEGDEEETEIMLVCDKYYALRADLARSFTKRK